MSKKVQTSDNPQTGNSSLGIVSGSYIWLVADCDGSTILSAHLTEEEAEKERKKLRNGYAPSVDFRVYGVVIS